MKPVDSPTIKVSDPADDPALKGPILFFDGVCNLCNRFVQFVIRHDKKGRFRFASLQSKAGNEALRRLGHDAPDSVILFWRGKYFVKSAAALHTAKVLGGGASLLFAFMAVPRFVRDAVYDFVAHRRYKWFGRRGECMIPTPELKARFIE